VVRCDEPQWSLFGVTMAGYNFLLSGALAAFAWMGALRALRGETK
jgi:disulfide bond formation protein DsbB